MYTRISQRIERHTESNGCKGALTIPRRLGMLLWPCRVKGTRKLARPSCYVKPKFSWDRPLLSAETQRFAGGRKRRRTNVDEPFESRPTPPVRDAAFLSAQPASFFALINSRHEPLSRLCPSTRCRVAAIGLSAQPLDIPRIKNQVPAGLYGNFAYESLRHVSLKAESTAKYDSSDRSSIVLVDTSCGHFARSRRNAKHNASHAWNLRYYAKYASDTYLRFLFSRRGSGVLRVHSTFSSKLN